MLVPVKYRYCARCGKKLIITTLGRKQDGFDRITGQSLYVREYRLGCPNYSVDPTTEFVSEGERHDVFVYQEPVE